MDWWAIASVIGVPLASGVLVGGYHLNKMLIRGEIGSALGAAQKEISTAIDASGKTTTERINAMDQEVSQALRHLELQTNARIANIENRLLDSIAFRAQLDMFNTRLQRIEDIVEPIPPRKHIQSGGSESAS